MSLILHRRRMSVLLPLVDIWGIDVSDNIIYATAGSEGTYIIGFDSPTYIEKADRSLLPKDMLLQQNYPNPFNPTTQITYYLSSSKHISLKIYNMQGQEVKNFVNEIQQAGNHSITWDGLDNLGNKVTSGLYFYTINGDGFSITKKMIMVQ